MKKVQILGSGCSKCTFLVEETKKAAINAGIEIELEKVTDFTEIMKFGVTSTPAFVVDGKVIFSGKVLKVKELEKILREA